MTPDIAELTRRVAKAQERVNWCYQYRSGGSLIKAAQESFKAARKALDEAQQ